MLKTRSQFRIQPIGSPQSQAVFDLGKKIFQKDFWLTKKFIQDSLQHPGHHFGIYFGTETKVQRLVGAIISNRFDRPKIWIFFLAVDKDFRRKGLASQLLQAIEKHCTTNYNRIFVDCVEADQEAIKFYSKQGFQLQAKIDGWFGTDGEKGLIYAKKIK